MRKHGSISFGVLSAALLASATASADPIGKDSSVKGNKENAGTCTLPAQLLRAAVAVARRRHRVR